MKLFAPSILLLFFSSSSFSQNQKPGTLARADSLFFAADYQAAREMYGKVLKDTSRNAGAWSRYGFSNLSLKNYDEALPLFLKTLKNRPSRPVKMNAFASLARVYAVKNEFSKATSSLDSAATLGYSNLSLVDTHEDFAKIRSDENFKKVRDRIYAAAYPCMANPRARVFDFWIGEWDVYVTGTTTYAGHSKIDLVSRGCALLENWDSNGSSGKSLNFIDPVSGMWKQTWIGSYPNGIQDFVQGEYKDGAMRFTYEARNAQGAKTQGRFIFYNEKPGQVRQFNEVSLDGGKTWQTNYDFTYVIKK